MIIDLKAKSAKSLVRERPGGSPAVHVRGANVDIIGADRRDRSAEAAAEVRREPPIGWASEARVDHERRIVIERAVNGAGVGNGIDAVDHRSEFSFDRKPVAGSEPTDEPDVRAGFKNHFGTGRERFTEKFFQRGILGDLSAGARLDVKPWHVNGLLHLHVTWRRSVSGRWWRVSGR